MSAPTVDYTALPPVPPTACAKCGEPLGRNKRFCSRSCAGSVMLPRRGAANNRYNGGLCFGAGRWIICCRDRSTILYSRGVMAAQIGRLLTRHEIVHHRNGDTADDRPENLQIVTRAEHVHMHYDDLMRGRGLL